MWPFLYPSLAETLASPPLRAMLPDTSRHVQVQRWSLDWGHREPERAELTWYFQSSILLWWVQQGPCRSPAQGRPREAPVWGDHTAEDMAGLRGGVEFSSEQGVKDEDRGSK